MYKSSLLILFRLLEFQLTLYLIYKVAMADDSDFTLPKSALVAFIAQFLSTGQGAINYRLLSGYDGKRTPSALEHKFRPLVKEARELNERIKNGEEFPPVSASAATRKSGKSSEFTSRPSRAYFERRVPDLSFAA